MVFDPIGSQLELYVRPFTDRCQLGGFGKTYPAWLEVRKLVTEHEIDVEPKLPVAFSRQLHAPYERVLDDPVFTCRRGTALVTLFGR